MDLINILFAKAFNKEDATKEYVNEAIKALKGEVNADLDTLEELSKALGNDPDFFLTVKNEIDGLKTELVTNKDAATENTKFAIGTAEQSLEVPSMEEFNQLKDEIANLDSVLYTAQTLSDAQKAQARENIEAASEADVDELKSDVAAITPDDTVVDGKPWTSKKIVDALCTPLNISGNLVQCHPVAGYPLGVKVSWEPVQEGSGDPSPDNIRPITGRDSVSVTRCGKNLFSVGSANIFINISGQGTPTVGSVTTPKIPCKAGDKFILTCKNTFAPAPGNIGIVAFYDVSDALLQRISSTSTNNITSTAPENASYVLASCYAPTEADEIVFELGSTATPYEPYTGSTLDIALPETVYGGTLDVESGVVTVEWVFNQTVLGDTSTLQAVGDGYVRKNIKGDANAILGRGTQKCNVAPFTYEYNGAYTHFYIENNGYAMIILPIDTPADTVIQTAHKTKVPHTIQLTPQQIAALSGMNTLYTDAGTLTVTGREDPRHTIVELKNAIISLGGNI